MNSQQFLNTVLMVSIFVLVFSVWTVCILFWMIQYARRRKRLKQRLGVGLDADARATDMLQLWRDEYQSRRGHVAPHKKETLGQRLARLFHEAGWKTPVGVLLFGVVAVAALAGVLVLVLGFGVWVGATVFCGVLAVFWFVTKQRVNSRIARFERQFVESLGIAARALRAGHPWSGHFRRSRRRSRSPWA